MNLALIYILLIMPLGFAGAFCHEMIERISGQNASGLWLRVMYRTFSWACLGLAAMLLSSALNLP